MWSFVALTYSHHGDTFFNQRLHIHTMSFKKLHRHHDSINYTTSTNNFKTSLPPSTEGSMTLLFGLRQPSLGPSSILLLTTWLSVNHTTYCNSALAAKPPHESYVLSCHFGRCVTIGFNNLQAVGSSSIAHSSLLAMSFSVIPTLDPFLISHPLYCS